MQLPKFNYELPVLDSSRAIVLENILTEELNTNYKSVNNFRTYLKNRTFLSSSIFMVISILLVAVLSFRSFSDIPFFALMFPVGLAISGVSSIAMYARQDVIPQIFSELAQDSILSRNTAITNWVQARYGVEMNPDTISRLYNNYVNNRDVLTRVGEKLVRFQTVDGEGELLLDSSGAELKVLSLQS